MAALQDLGARLAGGWTLEAVHHSMPETIVTGAVHFEWLQGEKFLLYLSTFEHPDFPDAVALLGDTDGPQLHYFDVRGVHRLYAVTVTPDGWVMEMGLQPDGGFAQRLSYSFEGPQRMSAEGQLFYDGVTWEHDIAITYQRRT